ncbi:MAG: DNA-directed RNA polymerase subunit beta' [Candidatus Paceibacterota bacterium]
MQFDALKITVASPEDILKWSYGEVIKPETINYRTQRPEKDGLFSERIFGPAKDYECYCGKYKRIRYKGIVCDKCGVEVTRSIVRRERMGHIELACPVCHIWFFKNVPSKLGLVLNVSSQKLERVVYYASFIVTNVNEENKKRALGELSKELVSRKKDESSKEDLKALEDAAEKTKDSLESLSIGHILSELDYFNLSRKFGDVFEAGHGAEALKKILKNMDLKKEIKKTEEELAYVKDATKKVRLLKRQKLLLSMERNKIRPEWMIISVLPVLPPDLRPMVPLDGGRYATSDLNDLYRRVINRNNRLKKLIDLKAPDVIVVNEKRMLQEAIDALIDNSARVGSNQQMSSSRRPLRSLSDMLKGKQGRFRQNLLGKRVDYSGRSVIVVGPKLRLNECGLPKKMALELFKPFVISQIIGRGLAHNIRNANRLIEQAPPEVWAILEEVIADRKVLLNRAPTLHRLSVQAFRPLLTEDFAIQIPPMVCSAFNADFDGDQMAVHLPLSDEAQEEARTKLLSSGNLLKPANGDPVATPTQDIILGCYYLTKTVANGKGAGKIFSSNDEALIALENDLVDINSLVKIGSSKAEETSCGRVIFNSILPPDFPYVNKVMKKKDLTKIIDKIIDQYGFEIASDTLDKVKTLGFKYATVSGITWAMADLIIPLEKKEIMARAEKEIQKIESQYLEGILTRSEKRNRVISVWNKVRVEIAEVVPKSFKENNPIYSIIDSGSRGSWTQPVQMIGMKGLVQNPKNEVIELPIKSSFKEGFGVLEYFISTHGSRKGLTDTALKTAQAGYLTRRLVDVAQEIIVREKDCKGKEGVTILREDGGDSFGQSFSSRIFSRAALLDVKSGHKTLVKAGEIITREIAEEIQQDESVKSVIVRSPLTCKSLFGVCSKCYGLDLALNKEIEIGEAVGVVAAQSIGEPGTQLTLRTFHIGGTAGADITHGLPRVEELFEARIPKTKGILAEADGVIEEIKESGSLKTIYFKISGKKPKVVEYSIHKTSDIFFKVGDVVEKGTQLSSGHLDLKELMKYRGEEEVQKYIIKEIQKIYASEGAPINNKHIEIIIRQMLSRVKITEPGDTEFLFGDIADRSRFLEVNREMKKEGKEPAKSQQLILGITKVSLSSESFLSAASFQETARVLVSASTCGKVDHLRGLKENVIIGRLIPVGTGFKHHTKEGFVESFDDEDRGKGEEEKS